MRKFALGLLLGISILACQSTGNDERYEEVRISPMTKRYVDHYGTHTILIYTVTHTNGVAIHTQLLK